MRKYRRKRYRLKKSARRLVNLVALTSIMLTITFLVKHILFDKKEAVNASMEHSIETEQNSPVDSTDPRDDSTSNDSNSIDDGNVDDSNNIDNNSNIDNSNNTDKNHSTDNSDSNNTNNSDGDNNNNSHNDNNIDSNDSNSNNNDSNNSDNDGRDGNLEKSPNKHAGESSLENYAFIGDSITEALAYYKTVNPSNVIASKGHTAKKALADIDKLVRLKPDKIFILLGLNDMLTERSVDRYIKNYTSLIREIDKNLPNAEIYVQSILPVDTEVKNSKLAISNAQIEEFNEGLKKLAMQEGIHYLDIASIVKSYDGNLREPDGIHYKEKFCNLWLQYIIENI